MIQVENFQVPIFLDQETAYQDFSATRKVEKQLYTLYTNSDLKVQLSREGYYSY